ncbi:MAG TPA: glutathione peroxidase [Bacteroidia bacterium]|nr:glutathione peroxidase [Bacteroidia bacterium]
MKTFHDFTVLDNKGKEIDLSIYKGKKVLVVNTASECGYTPQYAPMQQLHEKFNDKNLVVMAFPSNDFGAQEPGTNEQIATFCKKNYGVTFPVMSKITVKGTDAHPLYQWLTDKKQNGVLDSEVKWNFQKYLIDENGKLVAMVPHNEDPLSERITNWITKK